MLAPILQWPKRRSTKPTVHLLQQAAALTLAELEELKAELML